MPSLRAQDVSVRFGDRLVLDRVSIEIAPGEIVGLIGASGSGKTTLGKVLSGRCQPVRGHVFIGDVPLKGPDRLIATIHQSPRSAVNPRWEISEIIREPLRIIGDDRDIRDIAKQCLLDPELLVRTPAQVSDGQLQRACIARAFAQDPSFLICDEPTSALDPIASASVIELISQRARQDTGVLLISHDHRQVAACADRVVNICDL